MTNPNWPLGPIMEAARTRLGGHAAAADAAGISFSTWRKFEKGGQTVDGKFVPIQRPDPAVVRGIALVADIPPADAFAMAGLPVDVLAQVEADETAAPVRVGQRVPIAGRSIVKKYLQLDPDDKIAVENHIDGLIALREAQEQP